MNFSNFREHSSPLFKLLNIVKVFDLVRFHTSVFMFIFYNGLLLPAFEHFFTAVKSIHSYNTRSAANQSYYIPRARTNYGLYNIRFNGTKIWNSIGEDIKQSTLKTFKEKLKREYINTY